MLQLKTTKLQEMLAKAIRGVGNNKNIPLTSLMGIQLSDNTLTITTTDATNYLYIIEDVTGEDFYVCVEADQFSKLIARMTCEDISLDVKDNFLEVTGNGTYTIAIPLDEDGNMVSFPNPVEDTEMTQQIGTIQANTIRQILMAVKPALAITMEMPQYTNYYMGDSVMATDTNKISSMKTKVLDVPTLISAPMMELLGLITDETIEVYAANDKIKFTTPTCTVFGSAMPGIEDYSIGNILEYTEKGYPSMCKIPKISLLQLIDRISLFVESFDDNYVDIAFTPAGVNVSSKQSSGTELIKYLEVKDFAESAGTINIEMLRAQVKAQTGDVVEIWFGDETSIKMIDGNVTMVVALVEE